MQAYRPFAMAALGAILLAGCTSAPSDPTSAPPAPVPRFDLADPRVPLGAFASASDVGPGLAFPLFAPAVNMTSGESHRETSLAVSPAQPGVLFACDPAGVPNLPPPLNNGHSYFYLSTDNGTTWTDLQVEPTGDPRTLTFEGGDCDVAIDAAGTLYTADTWLGEIAVGSSKDLGKTWQVGNPLGGYAPVADRPWLVGGPAGTLYMAYQDMQALMPSAIWFTKSTDYGLHFDPPVPAVAASPDGAYTWEGNYAISPDGQDIYLIYNRQAGPNHQVDAKVAETVSVAVSHDGGLTWTQHVVSERPATASYLYPAIAMDAGGILHAVFAQPTATAQPVWYTASADQGVTWTEPVPLLDGVAGESPWIAAGAKGQAFAVWFGSPDPKASPAREADYYLYWARITGSDGAGNATVQVATTTPEPLFSGKQRLDFAEFDMVRLDAQGRAHIGASVPQGKGDRLHWQAMYQVQAEGPMT